MPKRMGIEVTIEGNEDPTIRVLAMEQMAIEYCKSADLDQSEAIMMLLCAATKIYRKYARNPDAVVDGMSDALGSAIRTVTQIPELSE
jgi:uroporphyrinogen-III decarboxylase